MPNDKNLIVNAFIALATTVITVVPASLLGGIVGFLNFGKTYRTDSEILVGHFFSVSAVVGVLIGAWLYNKLMQCKYSAHVYIASLLSAILACTCLLIYTNDQIDSELVIVVCALLFTVFIYLYNKLVNIGVHSIVTAICVVVAAGVIYTDTNFQNLRQSVSNHKNQGAAEAAGFQLYSFTKNSRYSLINVSVASYDNRVVTMAYNDNANGSIYIEQASDSDYLRPNYGSEMLNSTSIPTVTSSRVYGQFDDHGDYRWVATKIDNTYVLMSNYDSGSIRRDNVKELLNSLTPVVDNKLDSLK
jgi:hypothetical protein